MTRRPAAVLAAALLFSTSLSPGTAHAGRGGIDTEHFTPHLDGRGLFNLDGADALRPWQFALSSYLHYSSSSLVATDGAASRTPLVDDRLTLTLTFALGLLDWLQLGVGAPFALWNDQNSGVARDGVSVAGLGSIRLELKFEVLDESRDGVGLAFLPRVSLPTGNHNAFLGQNFAVFSPMFVLERSVADVFRFVVNFGLTVRETARYQNITVDDELHFGVGFGFRLHERVELGLELFGATAARDLFGADPRNNPLEATLGLRVALGSHLQLFAGGGPGLSTGYGTPTVRFFAGLVLAPHERDSDGDGVADSVDRCPSRRGPAANHGCPWPDSDGDGLADDVDKCPRLSGPRENRGCPWPDSDGDGLPDKDDRCPQRPGPLENRGCPWTDRDNDGVLDKDDKCPDLAGPAENKGCPWPDTDGDGVLDKDDRCPTVAGPAENNGCPFEDTDKDGVLDKDDKCPTVPGPRENQGCPRKR